MPSYILSQLAVANAQQLLRHRLAGTVQRGRERWFFIRKNCNHDCMIYFIIYRLVPHKHNLQVKTLGSVNNLPHLLPSMTSSRDAIKVGVQLLRAKAPKAKVF